MRKVIIILLTVALSTSLAFAAKVKLEAFDNTMTATTTDTTCLHEAPDADSETIMCFKKGTEMKIVAKVKGKKKVEGKKDYWYKAVLDDGSELYVFGSTIKIKDCSSCSTGCK